MRKLPPTPRHRGGPLLYGVLLALASLVTAAAAAAPLDPNRVTVTLIPHPEALGHPEVVSFGLPLPPGVLTDTDLVTLQDAGGQEIPAHVRSLGPWRSLPPSPLLSAELPPPSSPGLRSILVQFSWTFSSTDPVTVTVLLNQRRALNVATETPVRSTWRLCQEGTYQAGDGVYEPKVYALLPPEWLTSSNLTTLASVSGSYWYLSAFDEGQLHFFHSVINNSNPNPSPKALVPYKTDYEPWLYDRSQTFYNGYIRTGKLEFLREAHRAAQYYMSQLYSPADQHLDPGRPIRGFFRLKSPPGEYLDSKYSYNECLATLYWLTGDPEPLKRLPDVTAANQLKVELAKVPRSAEELALWTERHVANALLASLFEYEVTGAPGLAAYLRKAIDALWKMQNHPALGNPPNGAFNHYVAEGGKSVLNFSPWMSSLLAHALLRTYHTLGDERIPTMLVGLAQAEVDRALRQYQYGSNGEYTLWVPRYVAPGYGDPYALDPIANYRNTCVEHAIDVAYVTALGAYFTTDPAQKERFTRATLDLLYTHTWLLQYWTRWDGWPGNGLQLYRVGPPRKYAWWYKNTSAIGPLLGSLDTLPAGAPDLEPPTIRITDPVQGEELFGAKAITVTAADAGGIAGVRFFLDGVPLGAELSAGPYMMDLDPAQMASGSHTLSAVARDRSGNSTTAAPVTISVPPRLPTVSFQNGLQGYRGTQDATISDLKAKGNGGNGTTTKGARARLLRKTGPNGYRSRVLLRFDKLVLPAGARVKWATLTLSFSNPSKGTAIQGYYLNAGWDPSSVKSVTWLKRTPKLKWTVPGAEGNGTDRIAGRSFRFAPLSSATETSKAAPLDPAIVQSWIDSPATNHGLLLTSVKNDIALWIESSESALVSLRPKLTIAYTGGPEGPPPADTDKAAPRVRITAPTAGATLSGSVLASADAQDNVAVVGVRFLVDGTAVGSELNSAPYETTLNTAGLAPGSHSLVAAAWDAVGNTGLSPVVKFSIDKDRTAPTVRITTPAEGTTVTGAVAISAAAEDDVKVVGVQFLLDGAKLGAEDKTAPYGVSLAAAKLTPGPHALQARARDAAGNQTLSEPIQVTVPEDTVPPTVRITSPAKGATLTKAVTLSAVATDNTGVAGVQFLVDGAPFAAEDTQAPFSVPLDVKTLSAGAHRISAVARDAAGNQTLSAPVQVTLVGDTSAPTLRIISPRSRQTVSGPITLKAVASDNVGVVGVQFRLNGAAVGPEDTKAPFSWALDTRTLSPGTYSVTAVGRDAAGNRTTSAAVPMLVAPDRLPPTVRIKSPAPGATLAATTTVTATAADNVKVLGVQFLLNGSPLGPEDTQAPYAAAVNPALLETGGAYTLEARARDAAGNVGASPAVKVTLIVPHEAFSVFQNGIEGYQGTRDLEVSNRFAKFTRGEGSTRDQSQRVLLLNHTGAGAYRSRGLLRFDGLSLPPGSRVRWATLTLSFQAAAPGAVISGYYLQAPWNASSAEAVSWLRRDRNLKWASPGFSGEGTDRIPGKSFVLDAFASGGKIRTVALDPQVVQQWLDSADANQGVALVNDTPDRVVWLRTSEQPVADLRPRLTIGYVMP